MGRLTEKDRLYRVEIDRLNEEILKLITRLAVAEKMIDEIPNIEKDYHSIDKFQLDLAHFKCRFKSALHGEEKKR